MADSAAPAYFIALCPGGVLHGELARFIGRYSNPATDPHVTVKAQPGLEQPAIWLDHVVNWAATYPPVDVMLGEPRFFGEEILYLSVTGTAVDELHRALLEHLGAIGVTERFEYEGEAYVPHITLSATWLGRCVEELAEIAEDARARFQPTVFRARTLSVFRSIDGVHYERWRELPLSYVH